MLHLLTNKGACAQANIISTGGNYCELDIKEIKAVWFAPYGYKFPSGIQSANELLLASVQAEIVALNLVPQNGVKGVAYTTEANRVKTYSGGEKALIGKNPIQIDLTFEGGVQNYQALLSLEKRTKHSVFLIDEKGTIWMSKSKADLLGGLNAPFFHVEPYKGLSGTEGGDFMVQFQLDRDQFDTELVAIQIGQMNFNPLNQVNSLAEVVPVPISASINSDALFAFNVKQLADQALVSGLGLSAMSVNVNGANVPGTFTASGAVYTFTRTSGTFATADVVETIVNPQFISENGFKGSSEFVALV